MGSVQIIINQTGKSAGVAGQSRDDLDTGLLITLTNNDNSGVTIFNWQILDKPSGSSISLSTPSSSSSGFTPDKEGSYLIKLTLNNTITGTAVVAIKSSILGIRIPAAGETNELGGWQDALKISLESIETATTTTAAHAIGSSSHTSSTLSNLNSKISDATLDGNTDSRPPNGSASGDLSGTYPSPTVDAIQGRAIDTVAPSVSDVLGWDGSKWTPTSATAPAAHSLSGSSHIATTLAGLNTKITDANLDDSSSSRPPLGTASGDLSGSYPNPTVDAIQGRPISASAPTPGQGLVWGGSNWAPATVPPGGSAGGDLSGTYPNPTVDAIQGNSISSSSPSTDDHLKWDGSVWAPSNIVEGTAFSFNLNQSFYICVPPEIGSSNQQVGAYPDWCFRVGLTTESYWLSRMVYAKISFSVFVPQGATITHVFADVDPIGGGDQMKMYVSRFLKVRPLVSGSGITVFPMNSGYFYTQASGGGREILTFVCDQNNSNWNSSQITSIFLHQIHISFYSNSLLSGDRIYGIYIAGSLAGVSDRIAPNA